MGLSNDDSGYCQLTPPPDRAVQPGDQLVLLRPGRVAVGQYRPLPAPLPGDTGGDWWDPTQYVMR